MVSSKLLTLEKRKAEANWCLHFYYFPTFGTSDEEFLIDLVLRLFLELLLWTQVCVSDAQGGQTNQNVRV